MVEKIPNYKCSNEIWDKSYLCPSLNSSRIVWTEFCTFKVWLASWWKHLFRTVWYVPWKHWRVCGQPRWQPWWNFAPKLHLGLWFVRRLMLKPASLRRWSWSSFVFVVLVPANWESASCFTSTGRTQSINSLPGISYSYNSHLSSLLPGFIVVPPPQFLPCIFVWINLWIRGNMIHAFPP